MTPYYQDETVTIYHGDAAEVLPRLEHVGLVLADAPYGIDYQSNWGEVKAGPIVNDGRWSALSVCRAIVPRLNADHVLWFTRWDVWPDVALILSQQFPVRGLLVWDKGHPGMGDLTHWGSSYELIASAGGATIKGGRDGSILRFSPVPPGRRSHPTQKPVELLRYLLTKLQPSSVCDPFIGSGSTLLAAKQLGIRAIGIEIEERYCEIAANRCRQEVLGLAG